MLTLRVELKDQSDLGEFGARAIRDALKARGTRAAPLGADHRPHPRAARGPGRPQADPTARPAGRLVPARPRGAGGPSWTASTSSRAWSSRAAPHVEVLNATSLHGGLVASWPMAVVTAKAAVEALVGHWRAVGLPAYAQFDNDTIFQGPHQHKDVVGRVVRALPEPGRRAGLRPAARAGLPGGDRELQRPLAGQGLGPLHARVAGGAGGPVGPLRRRQPPPRRGADRGGPAAAAVPQGLGPGPPGGARAAGSST